MCEKILSLEEQLLQKIDNKEIILSEDIANIIDYFMVLKEVTSIDLEQNIQTIKIIANLGNRYFSFDIESPLTKQFWDASDSSQIYELQEVKPLTYIKQQAVTDYISLGMDEDAYIRRHSGIT